MSLDIWLTAVRPSQVFDANFTHNVTPMWREAGIYDALYMSAGKQAHEVLPALEAGLKLMQDDPVKYMAMDAQNGWGTYVHALPWLDSLVSSFRDNPDGIIGLSK